MRRNRPAPAGAAGSSAGIEWFLEVFGCPEEILRSRESLASLFREIVAGMKLHPVGEPAWHRFPGTGGITGFWLLRESHLAIHSFPEFGSACLNVFCCSKRPPMKWDGVMSTLLGADEIRVREYRRIYRK